MIKKLIEKIESATGGLTLYVMVFFMFLGANEIWGSSDITYVGYLVAIMFVFFYQYRHSGKAGSVSLDTVGDFQKNRLEVVGENVEGIIHQWKQPLSVISATASGIQIQSETGGCGAKEVAESMQTIMQNVDYMSKTMASFRDFLSGEGEYKIVNMSEEVEKSILIASHLLKGNNVSIKKDLETEIALFAKLHPNLLAQVIVNITVNAKDAFLKRNVQEPEISVLLRREGDCIVVEISDNAGGIELDLIEKIFDYGVSSKKDTSGSGIGLFVAKKIVDSSFGGEITVQNTQKGATFFVKIPLF